MLFVKKITTIFLCIYCSNFFVYSCKIRRGDKNFPIYWNVPTEMCHKYGFNFSELSEYGIIQNENDKFRGEQITILYDPGLFPAILGQINRNGGVPQEGSIYRHLIRFQKELRSTIANLNFSGVGIIDFEQWRPIWRENWGSLEKYRIESIEIEKKRNPFLPDSEIELNAKSRFEKAAFLFIEETLLLAKKMRPLGLWGYYAYPYCFNFSPKHPDKSCTKAVIKDNDRSSWMYESSTALFPSIYMYEKVLNEDKRKQMVEGRVLEAKRIAAKNRSIKIKVLPYFSIKYRDTLNFLSKVDFTNGVIASKYAGSDGIILWGSSKDTNSAKRCQEILDYVNNVIKPII